MVMKPDDRELVSAGSLLDSWHARKLRVRPYAGMFAFNPSVHFDGETWRCAVRCADYGMPGGMLIRGPEADDRGVQTHNLMVHLDPSNWDVVEVFAMQELHDHHLSDAGNRGFEDIRLFYTTPDVEAGVGGLQAIAASAHLWRGPDATAFPPEQVILQLDENYNIVAANPIRGDAWAGPQKNWVPFDFASEPRFLYSIDRGIVYGADGPIEDEDPDEAESMWDEIRADGPEQPSPTQPQPQLGRIMLPPGGAEFRPVRRPQALEAQRFAPKQATFLRGGGQLQYIADHELWLGIGHEMRLDNRRRKLYWHRFYACDGNGRLLGKSRSFKLAAEGIEFAAGMALDGDRLVISYGVDDAECRIGECRVDEALAALEEAKPSPKPAPPPKRPQAKTFSTHEPLRRPPMGRSKA